MMNKITTIIIVIIFLFALPIGAGAQSFKFDPPTGLGIKVQPGAANSPPFAESYVERIVGNIVGIFFAVGGLGVIIYFVWGAVDWILSGGDKEKVNNARKKMTHAIIGLTLLSLSYVIINIVGQIVGFNPLGYLQLRYLGSEGSSTINQ